MVAGNVDPLVPNHQEACTRCALDMIEVVHNTEVAWMSKPVGLRIGIATGPAVAGYIGSRSNLHFKLFGGVITLATGLQQACDTQHVLVSTDVHTKLFGLNQFAFQAHNKIEVKSVGHVDCFGVTYSHNIETLTPTRRPNAPLPNTVVDDAH